MEDNIVISSLNIGGSTTLAGLLSMLRLDKPHLVMFQEVKVNTEQLNVQVAKYGYRAVTNIDVNNPSALGTGVVWQSHLPVSDVYSVVECRAQALTLGQYTFINIYAPSGSQGRQARRDFFGQDIFRVIRGLPGSSCPILVGDFNSILSALDTERNFSDKTCPAYRLLHPQGRAYSFFRPSCAASRLDRFYIPQNLVNNVRSVTYKASLGDHCGVSLLITLPDLVKGPAPTPSSSPYWKLNTSVLKDEDFLENFAVMYTKLQAKIRDFPDIANWWDNCAKISIRKFSMGVSLSSSKKRYKEISFSYI